MKTKLHKICDSLLESVFKFIKLFGSKRHLKKFGYSLSPCILSGKVITQEERVVHEVF